MSLIPTQDLRVIFLYFWNPPTPPSPSQVLIMSFDMVRHHTYMHTQHVSYHTKCLVMLDQSPITIRYTGTMYQWFIILAITVMHVRFVSLLSFSFVKNSTETTSVLRTQVNILSYYLIYWQFAPEEITPVIKTCPAHFVLICFCHSVFLGISSPGLIYRY